MSGFPGYTPYVPGSPAMPGSPCSRSSPRTRVRPTDPSDYSMHDLEVIKSIGRGKYSSVEKVKHTKTGNIFAAKHPSDERAKQIVRNIGEVLGRLHHPNVIKLFGRIYESCSLLQEYAGLDLYQIIHEDKEINNLRQFLGTLDNKGVVLYVHTHYDAFRKLARDIASGLAYLHQEGMAHLNLDPQNILVSAISESYGDKPPFTAKISGFSQCISSDSPALLEQHGVSYNSNIYYCAPEFMLPREHPEESLTFAELCRLDIWSYGCLLYCLLNPNVPHPYYEECQHVKDLQVKDAIGTLMSKIIPPAYSAKHESLQIKLPDLEKLMGLCLNFRPEMRIASSDITRSIRNVDITGLQADYAHSDTAPVKNTGITSLDKIFEGEKPRPVICVHNVSHDCLDELRAYISDLTSCPILRIIPQEKEKVIIMFQRAANVNQLQQHTNTRPFYGRRIHLHEVGESKSLLIRDGDQKFLENLLESEKGKVRQSRSEDMSILTFDTTSEKRRWMIGDKLKMAGVTNIEEYSPCSHSDDFDSKSTNEAICFMQEISTRKNSNREELTLDKISSTDTKTLKQPLERVIYKLLRKLVMLDSSCFQTMLHTEETSGIIPLQLLAQVREDPIKKMMTEECHPQDIFLTAFLMCSTLLRKTIVSKSFLCKLAVPLVIPHLKSPPTLVSHAFRGINLPVIKDGYHAQVNAFEEDIGIISFVRISNNCPVSKSETLNNVIAGRFGTAPPTFFHRACANAQCKRHISSGMIEASWYLPSEKQSDVFPNELLFLNLRGNTKDHRREADFVRRYSSIVVIFTTMQDLATNPVILKEFYENANPKHKQYQILVLLTETVRYYSRTTVVDNIRSKFKHGIPKDTYIIEGFDSQSRARNPADLKHKLQDTISTLLAKGVCKISVKDISEDPDCLVSDESEISEFRMVVKRGHTLANALTASSKEKYIPLQSHWQEWNRLKRLSLSQQIKHMPDIVAAEDKMQECRNKQVQLLYDKHHKDESPIKQFCHELKNCLRRQDLFHDRLVCFVDTLKVELEKKALTKFSKNNRDYLQLVQEIEDGTIPRAGSEKKFEELEKKQVEISFSIHHLLREVAQIYESLSSVLDISLVHSIFKETDVLLESITQLALAGFPFEIMDGDTGCIPLQWIHALLQSIENNLLGKKIFVVSVIGVQSSGKSTMLNAMFGLDFPVSAGGCTRGVYGQLVRAEPGNKFDYYLVLDTEGIRGDDEPETMKRDNEIVTFVVGLSDLTIINVKGELYADVSDVLQISVHAFMRMHLQQSSRHCMFVHQNVAAPDAGAKLAPRRKKLVDTMNKAVKEISAQEYRPDISQFKDIVNFRENEHTFYFGDIWFGEPPMAPTNPHYHYNILKVKSSINDVGQICGISLNEIYARIEVLWNGILSEEFIFDFKTISDIKSTNTEIRKKVQNRTIDLSTYVSRYCRDEATMVFSKCKVRKELEEKEQELLKHQESEIREMAQKQLKEMLLPSGSGKSPKRHQEEIKRYMESTLKTIIEKLQMKLSFAKEKRWDEITNEIISITEKKEITEKAKKLAVEVGKSERLTQSLIRSKFETFWTRVEPSLEMKRIIPYSTEIRNFLKMQYPDHQSNVDSTINTFKIASKQDGVKCTLKELELTNLGGNINMISKGTLFNRPDPYERLKKLLKEVDLFLVSHRDQPVPFSRQVLLQIHTLIKQIIQRHNKEKEKYGFEITLAGEIRICARVLVYAEKDVLAAHALYDTSKGFIAKSFQRKAVLLEYFEKEVLAHSSNGLASAPNSPRPTHITAYKTNEVISV